MRFLKLSAYCGISLSISGATHSELQDGANTFRIRVTLWEDE